MALQHALTPITINKVTIKNRVVRTAHGTNIGQGRVNDDLIAYHEARARGGCGLTILEAASVHWTDTGTLRIHDASAIDDYRRLMARIEPHGMKVFQQLGHLGFGGATMDGSPPWTASADSSPMGPAHEMTTAEIAEVTDAFVRAASWVKAGGLDGVEIHIAHGFLFQEFLSPMTNHRTDRYGGSWENRSRFAREVVEAVRAEVGPDFALGIRTGSEASPGGLTEHDCAELVRDFDEAGLLDYVNVTYGSIWAAHKIIGGMIEPAGYELPASEVVTKVTRLPTIVTGRFRTLEEIDDVIHRGVADLVGMTRAHIADPDLVRKTMEGRADEVRPCIAANDGCIGGLGRGRLSCAVNPDVGWEAQREIVPADPPRHVVVVGGGPGGMEAARVSAQRGHTVTLVEGAAELGGAMRQAAELPYRSLVLDIVHWFARELPRLGVDVRLSTEATPALLEEIGADVVLLATGSTGGELPAAHSGAVTVVDEHGGYEALGIAEWLTDHGADVTLTTTAEQFGAHVMMDGDLMPTLGRLAERGTTMVTGRSAAATADGGVVVTIAKSPNRQLQGPLLDAGFEVHLVGDAADVGGTLTSIHSGNATARAL